jgi:hypothetical protein
MPSAIDHRLKYSRTRLRLVCALRKLRTGKFGIQFGGSNFLAVHDRDGLAFGLLVAGGSHQHQSDGKCYFGTHAKPPNHLKNAL